MEASDTLERRPLAKAPPLGCPDEKEAAIRLAENTWVNVLLGITEIAFIFVPR